MTTPAEQLHIITSTTDSYKAVSDLKKIINDEIKAAIESVEEKYADQLKELEENHAFYVSLVKQ